MHILLAHASVHGSTAEMADFMAGVLREHGYETTTTHVEALTTWDNYGAILPGAPVHGGVWVRPML
ncbi:MAG: flavodoxin domain-containing protein, partial [Anaerolineae bacterium]|nr:flavodoxin domain-containing protein [Anaerolineae bacterium]